MTKSGRDTMKTKPTDLLDPVQRQHHIMALKTIRELGGDKALAEYCDRIRADYIDQQEGAGAA